MVSDQLTASGAIDVNATIGICKLLGYDKALTMDVIKKMPIVHVAYSAVQKKAQKKGA